ncbi:hypothetical protein AMATHDRAFT_84030 [Amanita thiersii Skay4041]|uniref:Cwf19-like C-terminal domain-containing protein n=1 Tax=Amanita thiersii Skay4041 TaxID=703135 RepID=A0A2A9NVJ5_9AGAR|nr:hypothetical protein AMATHDRAFT_84030 [Amanita thiersii Skay4041]
MGHDSDIHKKRHRSKERRRDKDSDKDKDGGRKKRKHDHKHRKKEKHREKSEGHPTLNILDDDYNAQDVWVEKDLDLEGEACLATDIPTGRSLKITSTAVDRYSTIPAQAKLKRDEWMLVPSSSPFISSNDGNHQSLTEDYGEPSTSSRNLPGGVDFFSSLGTEHRKRNSHPERPNIDNPTVNYKELNPEFNPNSVMDTDPPASKRTQVTPGGPGSSWRMMRLRRVYETATEEGRPIEEVAIERFGTLEAYEEAKEERRIIDEREGKRPYQKSQEPERERGRRGGGDRQFMFNDLSGSGGSSRSSSFRRPGGSGRHTADISAPSTPSPVGGASANPSHKRLDELRGAGARSGTLAQQYTPPQVQTPIPSVMTPLLSSRRTLSPSSLNRLQAKVLRAKLIGTPDAEKLEQEYEEELRKANGGADGKEGVRTRVEVLPTLDARGRLYDVGLGGGDDKLHPGNRKKKEQFETHDHKTGEIIRINPDDDTMTLGEMLRQEKFGAGMADQKNLDAQFARAIMSDGKFENDLEYIDDNAEKLGRAKMRSDAMKRQFAIHDYKRTQRVLATCSFCYGEDDSPPKAPVVAMGTRAYLSCTTHEELLEGHCLIVPIQHHLTMLEGDDDLWDEVRNFMKSLMRMFSEQDKGAVFYETVISLRKQAHTVIECVPLPWEQYDVIPGYFKESILNSEMEWSQHKKLIDFGTRPGGFRRAMVPNLPYFMVQFDYKGEKGYGHVIEGTGDTLLEDGEEGMDEGEKGGGEFPRYFAGEIIGNLLDLEPRKWRRPRRIDLRGNGERVKRFRKMYDKYDWTEMIGRS